MPVFTLLDLAKLENGVGYNIIEENVARAPELRLIPADTMDGDTMQLTVRTDLPTVGFRHANEGTPRSKSAYENRVFQTAILDHQTAVDKAMADKRKREARARLFENHSSGALEAAFRHVGKQFYYGTGNDPKGFPGLLAQYAADTAHEVDATGASAKTSVWFVRVGTETLEFLFGNDRTITFGDDWPVETVYDANGNPFQAYTNWMTGNVGLRLANRNAVLRIKNIGTAANKTLTFAHLRTAYNKFTDLGWEPTHIFMSPRSQEQLWNLSVTPENPNPPVPTQWQNIPIIPTNSISNDE